MVATNLSIAPRPLTKYIVRISFNYMCLYRGVPRIWEGGGQEFFFQIWNFACREATAAHGEAMRIARGVWGHAPPRKFFKTVQFGAF